MALHLYSAWQWYAGMLVRCSTAPKHSQLQLLIHAHTDTVEAMPHISCMSNIAIYINIMNIHCVDTHVSVCMCMYMCIYIYTHAFTHAGIYIRHVRADDV